MQLFENYYFGFDRDGTLENTNHPIPSRLILQIENLRKQGAKTFFASGRSVKELTLIAQRSGIVFDIICGENGADILGVELVTAFSDLEIFRREVEKLDLPSSTKDDKKNIWTRYFGENLQIAVEKIHDLIVKNNLDLKIYPHPDYDGALDVVPRSINKTTVLSLIPAHYKIVYFGDSENDFEMMMHPRVSPHTMQNATDTIKKAVWSRGGIVADFEAGLGVSQVLAKLFNV